MIHLQLGYHSARRGYTITVVDQPRWVYVADLLVDHLCGATGHRLEWLYGRVANWAWRYETHVLRRAISKEEAWRIDRKFVERNDEQNEYEESLGSVGEGSAHQSGSQEAVQHMGTEAAGPSAASS